jgi:excisionase family DNA binding protein
MSGFSKAGLKAAVKSGTLRAIKQGGRWRVQSQDLEQYVKCLFGEAAST